MVVELVEVVEVVVELVEVVGVLVVVELVEVEVEVLDWRESQVSVPEILSVQVMLRTALGGATAGQSEAMPTEAQVLRLIQRLGSVAETLTVLAGLLTAPGSTQFQHLHDEDDNFADDINYGDDINDDNTGDDNDDDDDDDDDAGTVSQVRVLQRDSAVRNWRAWITMIEYHLNIGFIKK